MPRTLLPASIAGLPGRKRKRLRRPPVIPKRTEKRIDIEKVAQLAKTAAAGRIADQVIPQIGGDATVKIRARPAGQGVVADNRIRRNRRAPPPSMPPPLKEELSAIVLLIKLRRPELLIPPPTPELAELPAIVLLTSTSAPAFPIPPASLPDVFPETVLEINVNVPKLAIPPPPPEPELSETVLVVVSVHHRSRYRRHCRPKNHR